MSDFRRFYKQNVKQVDTRKKVVISERMVDEQGEPIPWSLKPIKQSELTRLASEYMYDAEQPDRVNYMAELISRTVVDPVLTNADLQDSYGVMNVADLLDEMLINSEYETLIREVHKINGSEQDINKQVKEVKN